MQPKPFLQAQQSLTKVRVPLRTDQTRVSDTSPCPSVIWNDGREELLETPLGFPDPSQMHNVADIEEPMVLATLVFPAEYLGSMMKLCGDHRGELRDYSYLDERRIIMKQELPMNEVMTDFFDQLKSLSSGYASFDYEPIGYKSSDLVKVSHMSA